MSKRTRDDFEREYSDEAVHGTLTEETPDDLYRQHNDPETTKDWPADKLCQCDKCTAHRKAA
jgi:hypothetical protein